MIPPMMLAHLYDDEADDPTDWWMSEKLDGIRAWWDGTDLWTKKGNRINAPRWFKAGLPPFPVEGELWAGRGRFAAVSSAARKKEPDEGWGGLTYHLFDAPEVGRTYEESRGILIGLSPLPEHVALVKQYRCLGRDHLTECLASTIAAQGEGLMMRLPGSKYEACRSRSLLKVKPYKDAEAVVIGYEPGEGKHTGRVGALRVEARGVTFRLGTGLTDIDRERPPAVGAMVTYRYTELMPSGKPRHARFMRERVD